MNSKPTKTDSIFYGDSAEQHLSLTGPAEPASPRGGIVALIHGGYWRSTLSAALMEPLAESLVRNGWMVANIEYRRGAEGRWPAPLDDCREALAFVGKIRRDREIPGPLISIGHSVGGQLALLTANAVDAVVALAPVTDVERTYNEGLGEDAASEYFESPPAKAPEIYNEASPIRQLPIDGPVLLIHGINDARVPIEHSRAYLGAAQATGSAVQLFEHEGLGHREAIDSTAVHWAGMLAWMNALAAAQ